MLHLVVSAPGGRKAELECAASATFGDVKARIEQTLGVPPDKQKLLCNGKERKNAAETLASAGVTGKSKLMLMLAPGFQMPPAPTAAVAASGELETSASAAAGGTAEMEVDEAAAVDLSGELPLPAGAAAMSDGCAGVVHVRQGRSRYHISVRNGLAAATFGELASYMSTSMLFPPDLPPAELRFIVKGKTADSSQPLADESAREVTVMLLFREGFHLAAEGASWLQDQNKDLTDVEALLEKKAKQIEANFTTDETALELRKAGGVIGNLRHSVEIVQVREATLPEMARFRDRVIKADEIFQELMKALTKST